MTKTKRIPCKGLSFWNLEFGICLGFGAWDLEFKSSDSFFSSLQPSTVRRKPIAITGIGTLRYALSVMRYAKEQEIDLRDA
mgnify:CR=1 FL=1